MSIGGQTCIKITTRPLLCVDFSYPTSDLGRHIRLNNSKLYMTMIKNRASQPVEVFSVFWMNSKVLQFCFSYLVFNQYPNTNIDTSIYFKVYLECHLLVTNLFHASLAIFGPMSKKINMFE